MARLTTRRPAGDRGVTLIEVLVVITILGVIMGPLAAAFISYFRDTSIATNKLSVSHDAQISAAYFAQDVASTGRHDWTKADFPLLQSIEEGASTSQDASSGATCGAAKTLPAVIRLLKDDPTNEQTVPVIGISYVIETVGGETQLHRIVCETGHPTDDTIVAHNLVPSSDSSTNPVVVCYDDTGASMDCTSPPVLKVPHSVKMTLQLRVTGSNDQTYTVVLTGQRRQT